MPSIFKSTKRNKASAAGATKVNVPGKGGVPPAISAVPYTGNGVEFGALIAQPTTFPSPPVTPTDGTSPPLPPKYSFLPTRVPHRTGSDNSIDSFGYTADDVTGQRQYGFLGGVGAGVILGLDEVKVVVEAVARELESRGLTLPMLFSNQALEASQPRTKLLIQAYIDSISSSPSTRSQAFTRDLQYAKEYELAWFLRWALSRITRVSEGTKEALHGLLEWEVYEEWRGRERSAGYPHDAFPYLSALIPSPSYTLLCPLFHLLSRLAAHSHLSGLTPHALSSLFAPLLFDIPTSAPALTAHSTFVRAASATEHLLLAYIRSSGSGHSKGRNGARSGDLGVGELPGRLREWVAGYPAMLASDADLARGHTYTRKGAKVVRCERATRTVRAYSKDLVVGAEKWVGGEYGWATWDRVITSQRGDAGRPKFSAAYRRRMVVKETPPLPLPLSSEGAEPVEYGASAGAALRARGGGSGGGREEVVRDADEEARWGSLAGKEWSMFEEGGFSGGGDFGDKLRFDLTESAKMSIAQKRQTMSWTEFAASDGGFNRTDPVLSSTLVFSPPLATHIAAWPQERSELQKRLHKSQKESVPFAYDTAPRFGADAGWDKDAEGERGDGSDGKGRVYVEEAFLDFWADLGMGAGWVGRGEMTFREANWAFVEYKAVPSGDFEAHPREDPRRGELCFLFEERVPYDYQYAIANPVQKRSFNLFSRKKKGAAAATGAQMQSQNQLAASLMSRQAGGGGGGGSNGLGLRLTSSRSGAHGTSSGTGNGDGTGTGGKGLSMYSPAQAEFDRMLMSGGKTKKVQLGRGTEEATIWHKSVERPAAGASAGAGGAPGSGAGTPVPSHNQAQSQAQTQGQVPEREQGGGGGGFKVVSRTRTYSGRKARDDGGGEGRTAFFSRSMRRSGKDRESKREHARMRQEQEQQEIEFEIESASGVESNLASVSPGKGAGVGGGAGMGKGPREVEKDKDDDRWMDILIANGARRMDRQDASFPAGPQSHAYPNAPRHAHGDARADNDGEMDDMYADETEYADADDADSPSRHLAPVNNVGPRGLPASPRPDATFSTPPGASAKQSSGSGSGSGAGSPPLPALDNYHSPEVSGGTDEDIRTPGGSAFSSPRPHGHGHGHGHGLAGQPIVVEPTAFVSGESAHSSPSRELQMRMQMQRANDVSYADDDFKPLPAAPRPASDADADVGSGGGGGAGAGDFGGKPRFISRNVGFDPYASPVPAHNLNRPGLPESGGYPASPVKHYTPPREQRESIGSYESGSDRAEVLAPSPVPHRLSARGRDTIVGIVDGYRDSGFSGYSGEYTESSRDDTGRYSRVGEQEDGGEGVYAEEEEGGGYEGGREGEGEEERIRFRPASEVEGDELGHEHEHEHENEHRGSGRGDDGDAVDLMPPGPVFDIAPTREPSPGRYPYGLPLHYVREEEEDAASARGSRVSGSSLTVNAPAQQPIGAGGVGQGREGFASLRAKFEAARVT